MPCRSSENSPIIVAIGNGVNLALWSAHVPKQDLDQVLLVPGRFLALALEATFGGGLAFQRVESNVPRHGQVFGAITLPNEPLVLAESDVKDAVHLYAHFSVQQ